MKYSQCLNKLFLSIFLVGSSQCLMAMELPQKNCYETLEIGRDVDAKTIYQAFRRLVVLHHPSKSSQENRAAALALFSEINHAYQLLSDPDKRKAYDATLAPLPEPASLNQAVDGVHAVHISKDLVQASETELIHQFRRSLEENTRSGWMTFFSCSEAHLSRYSERMPCENVQLLSLCAKLLASKMTEKIKAQKLFDVGVLNQLLKEEKSDEVRAELKQLISWYVTSCNRQFLIPEQKWPAVVTEMMEAVDQYFQRFLEALDSEDPRQLEQSHEMLQALELALNILEPGLFAYKKAFSECVYGIDRIDQLNPNEGLFCLYKAFYATRQRGEKRPEWLSFLALCDVAIEKWGPQREMLYLQVFAQMMCKDEDGEASFQRLLNEDLQALDRLRAANRVSDVTQKLKLLQTVQHYYEALFNREIPQFKRLEAFKVA